MLGQRLFAPAQLVDLKALNIHLIPATVRFRSKQRPLPDY